MKIIKLHFLAVFFRVMAVSCGATDTEQLFSQEIPEAEMVQVKVLESSSQPDVLHLFSGQSARVGISVFRSEGTIKEGVTMKADVFQKAQSILAPFQKDILVTEHFGIIRDPLPRLVTWTYKAPEVKRETSFIVRFRFALSFSEEMTASISSSLGYRPEVCRPAGELSLTVYPPDFAKEELAQVAQKAGLRVFGNGKLRKYITAQKVGFSDVGENLYSLPANPKDNCIYLGEATSSEYAEWLATHPSWRGNIAVFCPDSPLLPGVFITGQNGFRAVKVTLSLLDTLSSDPRSQKTLMEILNIFITH